VCRASALFLKTISCATMQWKPKIAQAENKGPVIACRRGSMGHNHQPAKTINLCKMLHVAGGKCAMRKEARNKQNNNQG